MADGTVTLDFSKAQPIEASQPDSGVTLDFSKAQPLAQVPPAPQPAAPQPAVMSKSDASAQIDRATMPQLAPKQASTPLAPLMSAPPKPLSQGEQAFQQSVTQSGKEDALTPFRQPTHAEQQQSMSNLTLAPQRAQIADQKLAKLAPAVQQQNAAIQQQNQQAVGLKALGDSIAKIDADLDAQRKTLDSTNQSALDAFNAQVDHRNQLAQTVHAGYSKLAASAPSRAASQAYNAELANYRAATQYEPGPLGSDGVRPPPAAQPVRLAGPAQPNVQVEPDTRMLDQVITGEGEKEGRLTSHLSYEEISRQADAWKKYALENPGEAVGNAVFPGVGTTASGTAQAITGEGGSRGAGVAKALAGVGDIAQPFIGIDAVENPVGLAKGFGAGAVSSEAAGHLAHAAGASKETEDNIRSAAFWIPAFVGGKLVSLRDPKTGDVIGFGASAFDNKVQGAVARTPEAYRGGVKIGGTKIGVEIPRTPEAKSAGLLNDPTVRTYSGHEMPPSDAAATVEPIQGSTDHADLRESAKEQKPEFEQAVTQAAQAAGGELEGSRVKTPASMKSKETRNGETPQDVLGARASAETPEQAKQVAENIKVQFPGTVESKIEAPGVDVTQLKSPIGQEGDANRIAETQVGTKEDIAKIESTEGLYTDQKAAEQRGDTAEAARIKQQIADEHAKGNGSTAELLTVSTPAPKAETSTKYKHGNTQAAIPHESEAGQALAMARARISKEDLMPTEFGGDQTTGLEEDPHVTVRYGIKGDDTAKLMAFIESQAPFEATLGKTASFPATEHSDGAAPIIAPVNAPELHRINAEIEKHGDFAPSSFPEYKPHATVAYVDPAKASRYTGMSVTDGKKFTVSSISITDRNGNETPVQLKGAPETAGSKLRAAVDKAKNPQVAGAGSEGPAAAVSSAPAGIPQPVPPQAGSQPLAKGDTAMLDGKPVQVEYPGAPARNGGKAAPARVILPDGKKKLVADPAKLTKVEPQKVDIAAEAADAEAPAGKKSIAVDLDGTLANYEGFKGKTVIGEPVPAMVEKVKQALAAGNKVTIFTARVADDPTGETKQAIEQWSQKHLGQVLPVTAVKSPHFKEFWDDRAKQVGENTGDFVADDTKPETPGSKLRAAGEKAKALKNGDLVTYDSKDGFSSGIGRVRNLFDGTGSVSIEKVTGRGEGIGQIVMAKRESLKPYTYPPERAPEAPKPTKAALVPTRGGIEVHPIQEKESPKLSGDLIIKNLRGETVKRIPDEPVTKSEQEPVRALINAIYDKLEAGESLGNVTELNKLGEQYLGGSRTSGDWTPKDLFDAMEASVNKYLLKHGDELMKMDGIEGLAKLRELMPRLTSQGVRTEEQIKNQQFSTPPTESYVAAKVANLTPSDVVLEPSAGNGGLAVWPKAIGAEVHVNEIAPRRQQMLEAAGFDKPTAHDGELINALLDHSIKPTVILMNPPFSASTTKSYEAKNSNVYGYNHVDQALQRLAPGGRLVAILGGGQANEPEGGASLHGGQSGAWFAKVAQQYNVRANIRVNGKEYQKYGTSFATRIIVIDKDGPTPSFSGSTISKNVDTLEEAYNALKPVEESRPANVTNETRPGRSGSSGIRQGSTGSSVAANSDAGSTGVRGVPGRSAGVDGEVPAVARPAGNRPDVAAPRPANGAQQLPVPQQESEAPANNERAAAGSVGGSPENADGKRQVAVRGLDLEQVATREAGRDQEDESAYATYKPTLKGAEHPGSIVETKSMATVPMPPLTYKPSLPESVVGKASDNYAGAKLSAVQLEAVSIAGMQNDIILPSGARASALIGDGTGVGKGRIGAGILLDNWNKGRKRLLWVTKSKDLIADAGRDLEGIGAKQLAKSLRDLGKIPSGAPIEHEGVMFTTWSLLRSADKKGNTRAMQLDKWLRGEDGGDGGYMLMDESHALKNAVVSKGQQASQVGETVKKFLDNMPGLRTVSLSATAATDVMNLGYLDRLGLWGPGTPFPGGFTQFAAEISHGGMSAMEMIARELKAQGKYVSRTLTFKGVEYREIQHVITPEQKQVYAAAAAAWRSIYESVEKTIATTTNGGGMQKGRAMSAFFSTQQRFFNLLLTSIKIPTAVAEAEKALAGWTDEDGTKHEPMSVGITLINTNEAAQNREKDRVAAEDRGEEREEPDYDFGPGKMLKDMVAEHYPVQQYKDDIDSNGKPIKVPVFVKDKNGNDTSQPVLNPTAVAAREALLEKLDQLKMPSNPLDELIEQLGGPSKVAELTGRKQRYDPATNRLVNRGGNGVSQDKVNQSEMANFQSGKKRVAILSSAADTGISLHSDKGAKNQQRRLCLTLQVGWSADKAMQMNGRFNRSNQVNAPEYGLLKTDLGGESRFISSIAKRMESLEALSKGQTKTNTGTEAMSKVNFETEQGKAAANSFYQQLLRGTAIPETKGADGEPISGYDVLKELRVLKTDKDGNTTVPLADRTNVTRLLNRLLALDPDLQQPVYNYFYNIFDAVVKQAIADGTLDTGVKKIPGDSFAVKEFRTLASDPTTGAKTFYYPVDAQVRTERRPAESAEKEFNKAKAKSEHPRVLRNDKGQLVMTADAHAIVHADGHTEEAVWATRPEAGTWTKRPASDFYRWTPVDKAVQQALTDAANKLERAQSDEKYKTEQLAEAQENEKNGTYNYRSPAEIQPRVDQAKADVKAAKAALTAANAAARKSHPFDLIRDEWQKQYEAAPTHTTTAHHLIGGAVMRYWNAIREASGARMEVYSTVDEKTGQRVVGIDIPTSKIKGLLDRISGGSSTIDARQILEDVLKNGSQYELEGGVKVSRGRVAGTNVVKFVTANPAVQNDLKSKGVLYERGVQPIYYLPTDTSFGGDQVKAHDILEKILKQYPAKVDTGSADQTAPDRSGESGFARGSLLTSPVTVPIELAIRAAKAVKAGNNAYDEMMDGFIQKAGLGRAHHQVEAVDPQAAADLREIDAAPQAYRFEGEAIGKKITAGMTREQERGLVLMADEASRENLEANHPEEFEQFSNDPLIQKALEAYEPIQDEMREDRRAHGDAIIEESFLHRVYPKDIEGIGSPDGKRKAPKGSGGDDTVTTQKLNNKGRIASAEYFYEHGLHEFGPSFVPGYVSTKLKLVEDKAAAHVMAKATLVSPGDEHPDSIVYDGKVFYSPEAARQIREAVKAGTAPDDLPGTIREYGEFQNTSPEKRAAAAESTRDRLAKAVIAAHERASGTKLTEDDMDALLGMAHARPAQEPIYLAPKEVTDAFNGGYKHVIRPWVKAAGELMEPITGMVRGQLISMGFGASHIKNILRRVMLHRPMGQLDPRAYADAWNVLFDKELKRRGISGVDDPAFKALLRHNGISVQGIENFKTLIESNTDANVVERTWNLIKAAAKEQADYTTKTFPQRLRQAMNSRDDQGQIRSLPFRAAMTASTAIGSGVQAIGLQGLKFIGHHNIFKPGGPDNSARLWMYGMIRTEHPEATDDMIANQVNEELGRYARGSWTDMQHDMAPFMTFPGWGYSSVAYALKHPLKATICAALLTLLANKVIHALGKNKRKDSTDLQHVHIGNSSVTDNLFRERLANAEMGTALRFGASKLLGHSNKKAWEDAQIGIPSDAGAFVGEANPLISTPVEMWANKDMQDGKRIFGKGKSGEGVGTYAGRKLFPIVSSTVGTSSPTNKQPAWAALLRNLGTSVSKQKH